MADGFYAFDFQVFDGSTGFGELELTGGDTLSCRFENFGSGLSVRVTLRR